MDGMTERDAFVQAIIEKPEDDTPRLVFADWLDEHGEPERAEFIRVQCRIAVLRATCGCGGCVGRRGGGQHHNGPCAVDQQRDQLPDRRFKQAFLRLRERELLGDDFCRWGIRIPGVTSHYRRGFVAAVTLTSEDWLRHADALVAATPLEQVTLTAWPNLEWLQIGRFRNHAVGNRTWHGILSAEWPRIAFTFPR